MSPPGARLPHPLLLLPLLLLPFLAAGACGDGAAGDAERYRQVVADPALDPGAGLLRCGAITDPDLRGDCVVYLAGRREASAEPGADALCAAAPEGLWRDECHFVSAEGARRAGRRNEAARQCLSAGRFKDDCGQHLWQSEVRAVAAGGGRTGRPGPGPEVPPPPFAEALPRARSVYQRWAPLLEAETDMAQRFWRRFYQNGFEQRGTIDLAECAALLEEDRARCEDAGLDLVRARIDQDLRHLGVDPCALKGGLLPVSRSLRVAPHPRLDEALLAWRAGHCDRGPDLEVP